ncbi:peptide chain release factor N(5)-glutamine methyltransferase [Micromonospora tulbaghiae]|uniref:peptide chain release factor N(5)-glutamine methyltransferase n=1 Tax=Micromonospora tulbaghiae TaxID=479978 RepID=UPI0036576AE4
MINRVARALAAAGVEAPRAEAEQLAAYVLEVPRGRLALADGFTPAQRDRLDALVGRRVTREPLQHLLGSAGFRHLELAVGPGVFVPRPETELLAGWGIERAREYAAPLVVDLCSGSGAIALAVAQEVPAARVVAVERSPAALAWLRRNAAGRAAAGDRPIEVVAADVTDPDLLADLAGQVDVLLCNPPYVPRSVTVPPEVAGHDPDEAVFGGADGLDVIRPVVDRAAALLRPGGAIGIEHDDTHASAVPALLRGDGRYDRVAEHRDLAGRPRWASASRRADGTHADPAPAWQTDSS